MSLSEEFQKHEENRTGLAKLIEHPLFKQAVEALKEELEDYPGDPTEGNPVLSAAKHQQTIGVNYVLRGLKLLASTAPKKVSNVRPKKMPETLEDLEK